MCWLYVPGSEASNSASASPCPERVASVTWRGKPMQPRILSALWRPGGWLMRLSGLTLPPSTLDRGVASFIASLRATPASPTPAPASSGEPTTTASSLIRSSAPWPSAGLIVSLERTSRGTSTANLRHWSPVWSGWASALQREYSARPKPGEVTLGPGCSLWPTPLAHEGRLGYQQRPADKAGRQVSLTTVAVDWTLSRSSRPRPGAKSGDRSSGPPLVLNPLFLELLMGLPIGWTACEPAATGFALWRQRSLGALSKLGSQRRPDPVTLL